MGLAAELFLEDVLPSFYIGADIVQFRSVDLQMQWRRWWTVQDRVEDDVSAQAMREEKASDDALMDNVESSSIVQANPV